MLTLAGLRMLGLLIVACACGLAALLAILSVAFAVVSEANGETVSSREIGRRVIEAVLFSALSLWLFVGALT